MLRRIGLIFFSFIMIPLLLAVAVLHAVEETAMSPDQQKKYLEQAQFYSVLKEETVNEIMDRTFTNPEGLLARTISEYFRSIVYEAIDEQWLQSKSEEVLDSVHDYLRHNQEDQVLMMDMRDLKQTFLLEMKEVLEKQEQSLPIPTQYTSTKIIEDLSGYIPDEIDIAGLFLEADELKGMRAVYDGFKISLAAVYAVIAITAVVGMLVAATLKSGFIWLGVNGFISGGILLIFTGIGKVIDQVGEWNLEPEYIAYEPVIEQFVIAVIRDMVRMLVNGSGILIAAGVLCMVLSNYFYRKNRYRAV